MNANEIRQKFINFLERRGHKAIAPAPLVLVDDPTTLFTGSGMQPLMPYLLGLEHPEGRRLVDSQPCFRAQDIEDVGDPRHITFFEMLGNWSLGDYFKKEQIETFFAFLTEELGLDPGKLYVTCFIGSERYGIPRDDEAAAIWQKVFKKAGVSADIAVIGSAEEGARRGVRPGERIFFYDDRENWWSRAGGIETTPVGDPCGPDSEVFYDFGEQYQDVVKYGKSHPASDGARFLEIANQVFMQYRKLPDGSFEELKHKNIDLGSGLERLAAASADSFDVFETSLLRPIIDKVEQLSGKSYTDNLVAMRVIADHIRGAYFLAAQGLVPSNKAQGYVLRRLTRRAILQALHLGIDQDFIAGVVPVVAKNYEGVDGIVALGQAEVVAVLAREEAAFRRTIARGLKELGKLKDSGLTGAEIFKLQDTYGFPQELSVEEAARENIRLVGNWQADFDAALAEQRQRSQTATRGMFKGGLADDSEQTVRYHTVAHLLIAAMQSLISPDITQKGANITPERLRFDFAIDHKLSPEEIAALEAQVNDWIAADLPVVSAEYDTAYALDTLGAHGQFRDKYGAKVTVYTIGAADAPISREVCGGPHVKHTGELGVFKITKEESSSAGVRRVKAVLQ